MTLEQKPFEGMFSMPKNKLYQKEFLAFQAGGWGRYSAVASYILPCVHLPFWPKYLSSCLSYALKQPVARVQLKM